MEIIHKILISKAFWTSIVVFLLSLIIWFIVKFMLEKFIAIKSPNNRAKTNTKFIYNIVKYLIIILAALSILQINGVNVNSYITGLGIAGIIVGFALQDILKDMISGINIVIDNYFGVGDVVVFEGKECRVISLNLRATKLEDIYTGEIITASNRNISKIARLKKKFCVEIPFPYNIDYKRMKEISGKIAEEVTALDGIEKCEYAGVSEFGESKISNTLYIFANPCNKVDNLRKVNSVILDVFYENGIAIPYNQLDVHIKN